MKNIIYCIILGMLFVSCKFNRSQKKKSNNEKNSGEYFENLAGAKYNYNLKTILDIKNSTASNKATIYNTLNTLFDFKSKGFDKLNDWEIDNKNSDFETIDNLLTGKLTEITISKSSKIVNLKSHIIELFDPNNFDCGLSPKLKKKLSKYNSSDSAKIGFAPKVVLNNIKGNPLAIMLDGRGSNVLVHRFRFKTINADTSGYLFTRYSPTSIDFSESDYIEKNNKTYEHFFFTYDCSGYLSASVSIISGLNKNTVKTSATGAALTNKSVMVFGGVMYSPLHQAYVGSGSFSKKDEPSIKNRIETLESILKEIPEDSQSDDTQIFLNSNYKVVLTSNNGNSSFNGSATLGANGGIGSVSASGEAKASIERKSEFTNYDTFIVDENFEALPSKFTVKSIKDLIKNLNENLKSLKESSAGK